jgi:hypothetical protein
MQWLKVLIFFMILSPQIILTPYPLAFHYALLLIDSHSYILFFLFFEKYQ